MLPGELCNRTAELLGLQPNTTAVAWRALREDFQVTTGGRGRSAAHCVPSDAANLLIATIGKLPLKSYLKSWERFSRLTERGDESSPMSTIAWAKDRGPKLPNDPASNEFRRGRRNSDKADTGERCGAIDRRTRHRISEQRCFHFSQ